MSPLRYPDGCSTLLDVVAQVCLPAFAPIDGPGVVHDPIDNTPFTPFFIRRSDKLPVGLLRSAVVDAIAAHEGHQSFEFLRCDGRCSALIFTDEVNSGGPERRSAVIARLLGDWRAEGRFASALKNWRNELLDRFDEHGQVAFRFERAGHGLLGTGSSGSHLIDFVKDSKTQAYRIYVARRSASRKQFPGKLDAVVGGAISAGDGPLDTMVKESAEEASLDGDFVRSRVRCTGSFAVSRRTRFGSDDGFVVFPALIHTYELEFAAPELGEQIVRPRTNARDEVASFELMDEEDVIATIVRGERAPLPMLVMIDWLIKHGRITPESDSRYSELCAALHRPLVWPYPSYAA